MKLGLLGGGTFDLAAHRGEIVVMDFWATWCGPCVQALPILSDVTAKYKESGVRFFAVDQLESESTIQKFLTAKHLVPSVALDREGSAGKAYGVTGIPQTVIIGKDGTVSRARGL